MSTLGASGRSFGALAALVGVAASLALVPAARADQLGAEAAHVIFTGSSSWSLQVDGGTVKCTMQATGTRSSMPTTEFSLTPSFSGCTFAGLSTSVTVSGCQFVFRINSGTSTGGTTEMTCPAGKELTVTAPTVGTPKCTLHVPAFFGTGLVSYFNSGSGTTREALTTGAISLVHYSQTKGTAETGNCVTADSTSNGLIEFPSLLLTGESSGGSHVGLLFNG